MVPSSADIVIQNRRISQSVTRVRTSCDIVNIILLKRAQVIGDQNSLYRYILVNKWGNCHN